jgi:hypothetical protein
VGECESGDLPGARRAHRRTTGLALSVYGVIPYSANVH